ncbi:MAG: hypothetical protein L3J31_02025 [Bacteroidales bacterium]|nr:hypothetical protein [Bacteroidales bacterium]
MSKLPGFKGAFKRAFDKYEPKLPGVFFWLFLASFVLDRVVNFFVHFPFFVGVALLLFPLLFLVTQYRNPEKRKLNLLVFSFLTITILSSIVFLFGVKNISDLLFILLFFTVYFYYRHNINRLKISNIFLFLGISLILFSFTFARIDSGAINVTEYSSSFNWITYYDEKSNDVSEKKPIVQSGEKQVNQSDKKPEEKKAVAKKRTKLRWKKNALDSIEAVRVYHNGLFRIPHVASYFFGFLFLFFAHQYQKKKKMLFMVLLAVSLAFCIYTGSRAILAAFVLSMILFLFNRKHIVYLSLLLVVFWVLVFANKYFLQLSRDTFFYQYFAFIETSIENFTRLSRYRLWFSWWVEVRKFGVWELLIGKSYMNAVYANADNLDYKVWFHNDFLNIFYTFGTWCTLLYIWFFIKIYRDNKNYIRQNIFIFIFYCSMVITAIINGFYYYFPVFLLYMFFFMIKSEKQLAKV